MVEWAIVSRRVSAGLLKPGLTVYDVIYNPLKTKLLQDAEGVRATTISGIDMLVWQGIQAFEIFTGKKPAFEFMKKEAMKYL